jgi:DNA invertase Pin-like site-specific DNA recombinase
MPQDNLFETGAKTETTPVRAAQYIRMSTEHQQYSTENQADVVREYAARRGFVIVRTYADEGKSGLRIEGRNSLKQLIADVTSGNIDFTTVLVYDVSRWGRFQDADESAFYEYTCRRAGVDVCYCAEQFENDGSPTATIIKSVKRAMAGEYSRELSAKVFKGQCNLIQKGFRQGGPAGFGLRRMLIDQAGQPKGLLKRGEHKSLQTDRVILVPGPDEEVTVVHRVYELFTRHGKREQEIATILNDEGVPNELGRAWTRGMVHQILINEKYIGHNVYNRVSFKLKKKRVQNPPDMWVRAEHAFEGVVAPELFYTARGMILERNRTISDEDMLTGLRALAANHPRLSGLLIDETDGLPSSSCYRTRFGSLVRAYRLIGYTPERDYEYIETNRRLRALHPELVANIIKQLEELGAQVRQDDRTDLLVINDEFTASIVLSRCKPTPAGSLRWLIRLDQGLVPDITIAARMDAGNAEPTDFYLLPHIDITLPRLLLAEENGAYLDTYRFDTLDFFVSLAVRVNITVAA